MTPLPTDLSGPTAIDIVCSNGRLSTILSSCCRMLSPSLNTPSLTSMMYSFIGEHLCWRQAVWPTKFSSSVSSSISRYSGARSFSARVTS